MLLEFSTFFKDEEDANPSFLRMVKILLALVMLGSLAILPLVAGVAGVESRDPIAFLFLSISFIVEAIALYYVYRGKPGMAKLVVPLALVMTITLTASSDNGLRDISLIGLPITLIMSAVLLGQRAMIAVTPLTIISVLVVAYVDLRNDKPVDAPGWTQAATVIVLLLVCAAVVQILVNRLVENIKRARANEQAKIRENKELDELRASLEERVLQRTAELETSNHQHERRARQFEAITQVTRVITSIQDLDTLLPYITQVISEQFNVYHAGIFLLDKQREFAVLRAANSDGGRRMLMREHKLSVGQTGIVGFVTATGQPRIALDVGTDATYFNNPDMPDTHSEIALPLRYAGQIIGALDVQSIEPNAFIQEDVETLLTLADQVSATINNALSLEEIRNKIVEYQRSVAENANESWKLLRPKTLGLGFQLVEDKVTPLEKPLEGEDVQDAIAQNKMILRAPQDAPSALAIPIHLRGKVIGAIQLQSNQNYKITSDDAEIIEAITERLSLALETATLLQATRHRANIERVTTDISSKISSSSRFETILQTAAQELSLALGGSDVLVQIEPASIELGMIN